MFINNFFRYKFQDLQSPSNDISKFAYCLLHAKKTNQTNKHKRHSCEVITSQF